jgi:DNA (cytosine-5)-methyltransferase 1
MLSQSFMTPLTPRTTRRVLTCSHLSIREVARIQGFYDDFEFHGTYVDQAGQLGNAVPAILAEVVGKHLAKYL